MSAGYRGLLAPWVGGASAPSAAPPPAAGYTSLLAFWMGGAAGPVTVEPPVPPPPGPSVGRRGGVGYAPPRLVPKTYIARPRVGLLLRAGALAEFDPAPAVEYRARITVALRLGASAATSHHLAAVEYAALGSHRLALRASAAAQFDDHLARVLAADDEWLFLGR